VTWELSAPRIVAASTPSRIGSRKLLRSTATFIEEAEHGQRADGIF
jgi:hypothetical protein